MLRRFTDFILKNRLNAIGITLVCAFIPLIGSISILIAALVTLRKGMFEGAVLMMVSCIPYLVSYFTYPSGGEIQLALDAVIIMLVINVLTWVFAVILRATENLSRVFQVATVLGVIAVLVVHALHPDIQMWWQTQLTAYFNKTAQMVGKLKETALTENTMEIINVAKQYATGFLVTIILLNALLQLIIARWWQAVIFNPGSLQKELYSIRLGYFLGFLFIVGLIVSYQNNKMILDVMPVLYVAFCIAGLSLIHSLIGLAELNWLWLILVYVGVVWLFPLSVVILSMVGLLDLGLDIRHRMRNKIR